MAAQNMEFLTANYINTTTMLAVSYATASAGDLIDRKTDSLWTSDTASAAIVVTFAATQTIDRIVIQNTNMKNFLIWHDATATTFALTTTAGTAATAWTGNSASNLYLILASATATDNLSIECASTTTGDPAYIGEVWACQKIYRLDENPNFSYYKPVLKAKEINHTMSDGGTTLYRINASYQADVQLKWQTQTVIDNLKAVYDLNDSVVFVPFPNEVVGDWPGDDIYLVNWVGDFSFKEPAGNDTASMGFNGTIKLSEAPK